MKSSGASKHDLVCVALIIETLVVYDPHKYPFSYYFNFIIKIPLRSCFLFIVNVSEIDVYEDYYDYYDYELEESDVVNYTLSFVTSGCYYWNTMQDKWISDNCSVSCTSHTEV